MKRIYLTPEQIEYLLEMIDIVEDTQHLEPDMQVYEILVNALNEGEDWQWLKN